MSRHLIQRTFSKEGYYHIFNRGNNKKTIFHDEADYVYFIHLFERYLLQNSKHRPSWSRVHFESNIRLLAYCLMPNHFHLLLQQMSKQAFSEFMHCLLITYTKYYNKKYGLVGHLFQGTFKARLIEDDADLLSTSRYVHNNPRTKNSMEWLSYQYSSAQYYIGSNTSIPKWLHVSDVYNLLHSGFGVAKKNIPDRYRNYLIM